MRLEPSSRKPPTLNAPRTIGTLVVALCAAMSGSAGAQARADSVRAVSPAGALAELQPPLSPRRAFTYSLFIPGYAQSVLGRARTGTLIMAFETVALVMIRESSLGLREARRNLADSIIVSYVDAGGNPTVVYQRTPFSQALLRSRQEQLEDWIAVLVGNHLFSAIDAFVAAHLWDLPAEIALRANPNSKGLALRLYW